MPEGLKDSTLSFPFFSILFRSLSLFLQQHTGESLYNDSSPVSHLRWLDSSLPVSQGKGEEEEEELLGQARQDVRVHRALPLGLRWSSSLRVRPPQSELLSVFFREKDEGGRRLRSTTKSVVGSRWRLVENRGRSTKIVAGSLSTSLWDVSRHLVGLSFLLASASHVYMVGYV